MSMLQDYLETAFDRYAQEVALYVDKEAISYQRLKQKALSFSPPSSIFYAPSSLETVLTILWHLFHKKPFLLISHREPTLPNILLPKELSILIKTSGSTNACKIAYHSVENFLCNATYPNSDLTLSPGDTWLLSLPLCHVGGLSILFRTLLSGAAFALPFSNCAKISHLSLVPTQLLRYLSSLETNSVSLQQSKGIHGSLINPSNLKGVMLGGANLDEILCQKASNYIDALYLTYGMTETASQIATKKYSAKDGICFGNPLPHREIKLLETKEICVKGKTLFLGYWQKQRDLSFSLDPCVDADGWFHTSDIGEWTASGLRILGRKDRMFITGGENVFPEEIEMLLKAHPKIKYAFVDMREDPTWGTRPTLTVCSKELSKEEVFSYLLERLPKFKVPFLADISIQLTPYMESWPTSLKSFL